MFVFRQFPKNEANDLFKFFFGLRLHIASNVLGFLLNLPLKCGKLFTRLVDDKCNKIHVEMNGKFIVFFLIAFELKTKLLILLSECYCANLKPTLREYYLMFRVVLTTSKRVPLVLN